MSGNPAPRREAGKGAAAIVTASAGGSSGKDAIEGRVVAAEYAATLTRGAESAGKGGYAGRRQEDDVNLVAHTLNVKGGSGRSESESETFLTVAHALRADGFDASEDGTGRGTPLVPVGVALRGRDDGATAELTGEVMTALRTGGGGGDKPHVLLPVAALPLLEIGKGSSSRGQGQNGSGFGELGDPMFTLQAGAQHGVAIAFDETQITSAANRCNPQPDDTCHPLDTDGSSIGIMQSWRVRRLMPVECERLQGFPDGYTAIPYRGKPAADGPRYKALGNSMAVNVMRWIGRRIDMVEALGMEHSA